MTRNLFIAIYSLILLTSCVSNSRLYRTNDADKIYSGMLEDSTNTSLRQLLTSYSKVPLKDTLIIKYDYNNETCWNLLDQSDDAYIQGFVTRHKERVQILQATRPNVSFFDFREPGNNLNKLKKWNNAIIIDSSKQLMNLLFKQRSTCGNSIIVLPDKRFIFLRSDSHSEAMDLAQDKLLEYLTRK